MQIEKTFEETVVHYSFAPLVVMAIAAVRWAQQSKPATGAGSDDTFQARMSASS